MASHTVPVRPRASAFLLSLLVIAIVGVAARAENEIVEKLDALPGFKIEHVLQADKTVNGSWICMGLDPKGRLLLGGQRGQPVTRVTIKDGKVEKQEDLKLPVSETMGLLFAFDHLYINGFGKNNEDKGVFGLFRIPYNKGTDAFGKLEFLREWQGGQGEHGAHAITLGPDNKLWIVCGNFVKIPPDVAASSPHRNYADDRILPRAEDGNGFGAGVKPPGGFVMRMDADGKNAELIASGERNTYDIAWNTDGQLFGYDSDMEWDWGALWYRPTRVFQVVGGGDQGFREGSAKWPEYYADSLPATVNIGLGCPTGVTFGTGAKFPAKYQKALYILDWTYGRLIANHLKPDGAGYTGTWENFVAPKGLKGGPKQPLNLTDALVGEDGALYFTVGGRGTPAQLFRVIYTGTEPTAAVDGKDAEGADARALRKNLEQFHFKENVEAVAVAWPHLASPDRWIRYSARIAIERQPVAQWKAKALAETQPNAALTALLALARLGTKEDQPEVLAALAKIKMASLDELQQFTKLRVIQVSVSRHGKPAADAIKTIVDELSPLYPSKSGAMNQELCQVLLAFEAPEAVAKTVALAESAETQEEAVGFLLHLRTVTTGWTPDLQKRYFTWWTKDRAKLGHPEVVNQWFKDTAQGFRDGASFARFLGNLHTEAKGRLTPEAATELAPILAAYTPPGPKQPAKKPAKARTKLVKEWTSADFAPLLDQVAKGRNFENGKEVYEASQCLNCHRMGSGGGAVGPDLTAIASRFSRKDVLDSLLEPSKVISEQYQNMTIKTKDGKLVTGRVVEENDDKIVVQPNPLEPAKTELKKAEIATKVPSKLSPMPEGLLNNFTQEEILDLLAYLESGGRQDQPNFKK